MSDSMRPHRGQPTRLPRAWGSPGKNTGVGCHFLLQCMKVKSESEVTQSCPTLSAYLNLLSLNVFISSSRTSSMRSETFLSTEHQSTIDSSIPSTIYKAPIGSRYEPMAQNDEIYQVKSVESVHIIILINKIGSSHVRNTKGL